MTFIVYLLPIYVLKIRSYCNLTPWHCLFSSLVIKNGGKERDPGLEVGHTVDVLLLLLFLFLRVQ